MPKKEQAVRQSISLPLRLAKRVRAIAQTNKTSSNRVLAELIEEGLESREAEKKRFFALADRLTESDDAEERVRLKGQLLDAVFGQAASDQRPATVGDTFETVKQLLREVPADASTILPSDFSRNVDHYLYGHERED